MTVGKTRVGLFTIPVKKKGYPFRLIAGIDFDHPKWHNIMGYIRIADSRKMERGISKTMAEFWLTLEELDKLGVLLILSARFWAKTRRKERESRVEVVQFEKFWKSLREEWPKLKQYVPPEE